MFHSMLLHIMDCLYYTRSISPSIYDVTSDSFGGVWIGLKLILEPTFHPL